MSKFLRILHLEDNRYDAELVQSILKIDGLECKITRVETREEFTEAVERGTFDLILADYSLPAYDGLSALEFAHEKKPELPFIFVSGTLGEETAIDSLKHGATDYLVKERLDRLASSVRRALDEAEEHRRRKQVEQALAQERFLISALMDTLPDVIFFKDRESRFIRINKASAINLGVEDPARAIGKTDFDFFEKETAQIFYDEEQEIIRTGQPLVNSENKDNRPEKPDSWASTTKLPLRDEAGNIIGTFGISRDITERKRVEQRIQGIIEAMPDGVVVINDHGNIVVVNAQTEKLFGYPREELLGQPVEMLLPEGVRAVHLKLLEGYHGAAMQPTMDSGAGLYGRRKDGSQVPVDISLSTMETEQGPQIIAIIRDITERKQAEEAQRASEAFSKAILDNSPIGISVRSRTGRLLSANESWKKIWALSEDAFQGDLARERHELNFDERDDYLKGFQSDVRRVYKEGGYLHLPELEVGRAKTGGTKWISQHFYALQDAQGQVDKIVILTEDITEHKQAEQRLNQSNERYRQLFENSGTGVIIIDENGKYILANKIAAAIFGKSPDEVIGRSMFEFLPQEQADKHLKMNQELISTGKKQEYEETFKLLVGERTFLIIDQPIQDENGRNFAIQSSSIDITERKLVERQMQGLIEAMPDGVVVVDADGKIVVANPKSEKLFGYPREELFGQTIEMLIPERFRNVHPKHRQDYLSESMNARPNSVLELYARRKDGSEFPVDISLSKMEARQGAQIIAVIHDITDRKQVEEALRQSEQKFRRLVEHLPTVVYTNSVEDTTSTLYVSPQIKTILGYNPEEWLADPKFWSKTLHPEDYQAVMAHIEETTSTGKAFEMEYRMIAQDGHVVWVRDQTVLVHDTEGQPLFWQGIMLDISERKQAEAALIRSEAQYRLLADHMNDTIWLMDMNLKTTYISPSVEKSRGYTLEELQELSLNQNMTEASFQVAMEFFGSEMPKVLTDPSYDLVNVLELEFYRKDRSSFWSEIKFSIIRDKNGQPVSILGEGRDITERKLAEAALIKSEEFNRKLVEASPIGILYLDQDYRITFENAAMKRIMGVPESAPSPVTGNVFFDLPTIKAVLTEPITKAMRSGAALSGEEFHYISVTGKEVDVEVYTSPLNNELGQFEATIFLAQDITERKQAEETLARQSEELHHSNDELNRLYRASVSLLSTTSVHLPVLAKTIVDVVLQEFGQANCSVFIVNQRSNIIKRLAVEGPYSDQVSKTQLTLDGPGLVPQAIRSGEVINTPDVQAISAYLASWKAARAELTIPLKIGDNTIGAIDVQSAEPNAFNADDERLMSIFAERAALALEHARLFAETERRLQHLAALREIDQAIASSFDLRLSLETILIHITTQLGVHAADVMLFNSATQMLEYSAGRGFRTKAFQQGHPLRLGEGYAGRAALERKVIHISDLAAQNDNPRLARALQGEAFTSYYGVPLMAKGQIKGVLEIFHMTPLEPDNEWLDILNTMAGQAAIAIDNVTLFDNLQRSNTELTMAYDATIEGWSRALDLRDKETEGHTQRVAEMTVKLAHRFDMNKDELLMIRWGGLLHDIGKMGVPDGILLKPDALTVEEWAAMKNHPTFAYEMLAPIRYLHSAIDIPYCHHEKWDGTGYPRGLKGEQIPLAARIFAVVDVWDALRSDRPYRPAWPKEKVLEHIRSLAGTHFDPQVVKSCLESGELEK